MPKKMGECQTMARYGIQLHDSKTRVLKICEWEQIQLLLGINPNKRRVPLLGDVKSILAEREKPESKPKRYFIGCRRNYARNSIYILTLRFESEMNGGEGKSCKTIEVRVSIALLC